MSELRDAMTAHDMVLIWETKGKEDYNAGAEIKACPFHGRHAIEAWRSGWLGAYDHDADGKEH